MTGVSTRTGEQTLPSAKQLGVWFALPAFRPLHEQAPPASTPAPEQAPDAFFATHPDMVDLAQRSRAFRLGSIPLQTAGVEHAAVYGEALDEARARNAQLLGSMALGEAGVKRPEGAPAQSILERLRLAATGDEQAKGSLRVDASTEIIEMIFKSGAVMEVQARRNKVGDIEQFGQTTYHRQQNTLQYHANLSGALHANTIAEGQNGFFIEALAAQGALKGKKVLEWSLVLDNEKRQQLDDYGYYLDEMIGIIRMTEVRDDGDVTITSALVGGVDQDELPSQHADGAEALEKARQDQALATRFDIATVRRIYDLFGYENAYDMSTTELLATPLIVPAEYGVLDFVRLYDEVASEITGKEVFFGLTNLKEKYAGAGPVQQAHYQAHAAHSRERQAATKTVAETVVAEMLKRYREPRTAIEASQLLRKIAKNHAVQHVVHDHTADTKVFGYRAAGLIEHAQHLIAIGDIAGAQEVTLQAQKEAKDTGCPTAGRRSSGGGAGGGGGEAGERASASSSEGDDKSKWKWKKGKCRVSNCPTRPKTTMVGPCSVCYGCQRKFDNGVNPAAEYARQQRAAKAKKAPALAPKKKQAYALAA